MFIANPINKVYKVDKIEIEDDSIVINPTEKFGQKKIATKCADQNRDKVEIKSGLSVGDKIIDWNM